MADAKKDFVSFSIGEDEDEEEEIFSKISPYQNTDRQHAACTFTTCNSIDNPKCKKDENINNSNLYSISKSKEKHTNKRRQSDVSSSPQQNPIRGEACYFDRYRHRSDNDTKSRRFVLNASSKVPIEVRRNHSGSDSLSLSTTRSEITFFIII